jgi:hypothetical protein
MKFWVLYRMAESAWRNWLNHRSSKGSIPLEKFEMVRISYPLSMPGIAYSI